MATLAEVEQHRTAVEDVVTLAVAELVSEWRGLDLDDVSAAKSALATLLDELVRVFGPIAATLAADFYEEQRRQAGAAGTYAAVLAAMPSSVEVDNLAGWAGSALYVDRDKALSETTGGLQRLVRGMDRETIQTNVQRDPAGTRYARYASANACAFCALLATREQRLYASEESAVRVTGEVRTGRAPRGTRQLGEKYHDFCRCIPVPVFPGGTLEQPPYVAGWNDAYKAATKELGSAADVTAVLAHMREHADLR